jgi:hypothetical protein
LLRLMHYGQQVYSWARVTVASSAWDERPEGPRLLGLSRAARAARGQKVGRRMRSRVGGSRLPSAWKTRAPANARHRCRINICFVTGAMKGAEASTRIGRPNRKHSVRRSLAGFDAERTTLSDCLQ